MSIILNILLSFSISIFIFGLFNVIFKRKKNITKNETDTDTVLKSHKDLTTDDLTLLQLEIYKKFGEEALLDCGIPLEHVFIKPHYDNKDGVVFKRKNYINTLYKKEKYSNKFNYNIVYMILPEIVDMYTLWVWLHEIGHYMQNHLEDDRPTVLHEYEAEMYAEAIIKLCPIYKIDKINIYSEINNHFCKKIFFINLDYCINTSKNYVKTYLDKINKNDLELSLYKTIENYISIKSEKYILNKVEY